MNASPCGHVAPRALAAALFASSLCAACQDDGGTASASRGNTGAGEDDRGSKVTCTPAAARKIDAAGLTPAESYDSIAVRMAQGSSSDDDNEQWTLQSYSTLSETGQACASATSPACAEKIGFHPTPLLSSYCLQVCVEWSVVTTLGDEVERWAGADEVVPLLAPIDNADDALMVVASHGYDLQCPFESILGRFLPASELRPAVQARDDGFEVNATRLMQVSGVHSPVLIRASLHVAPSGEVTVLERREYPTTISGF
jgi:hypothetical protein